MSDLSVPAMKAPPVARRNPLTRSVTGLTGLILSVLLTAVCLGSLPWTLTSAEEGQPARYKDGELEAFLLPPFWAEHDEKERERLEALEEAPSAWLGTDRLGRDLLTRTLTGGGISIGIGVAAAFIAVTIGTLYGAIAGYVGGRTDSVMMRIVDVLYGLPYILLVVLLAVAGDALIDRWISAQSERIEIARSAFVLEQAQEADASVTAESVTLFLEARPELAASINAMADANPRVARKELSEGQRKALEVLILLTAIGGVSWLTMARVIRGQVLSLRSQPFMEAANAIGTPLHTKFLRHLLPNLIGPIVVYTTLIVPQAILQESFLSFLGIGVQPPLPSWGNLAAEGLTELNTVKARWWLLLFPCALLGITLLSLNFVGEGLREAFDPKRARR
ncbi:MAG: ABC transporter permease [Planctomycetota bacterium]